MRIGEGPAAQRPDSTEARAAAEPQETPRGGTATLHLRYELRKSALGSDAHERRS